MEENRRAAIVDDNLMFAMMIEPQLRRLRFETRLLSGGTGLPDQVAAFAPEVVFVNLTSSRFTGTDLVRELRSSSPHLPIVGYAGHVQRELFPAGREAGCDLVVPNSAVRSSVPQVLEKLRRVRSAGSAPAATEADADDWEEEPA